MNLRDKVRKIEPEVVAATTRAEVVHRQEMKVIKNFHRGMDLFSQGVSCPIEDSALCDGWMAAQERDQVKKKWLSHAKERFID
jgi:hypothetical protein